MVVSSTGSVSLYTVQGTDMVPFDTRLAHRSGTIFQYRTCTGSGTADTDTLCNGTKNCIMH